MALSASLLCCCTGDRVGEITAVDAGSGGSAGQSEAGGDVQDHADAADEADAVADAGGPELLASARDCPSDFRVVQGTLTWVDQGSVQNNQTDGVVATMPAGGCSGGGSACITVLAKNQKSPAAVEIDTDSSSIFWTTITDGIVWKLTPPATTPQEFSINNKWPRWLGIEPVSLSIYWTNSGDFGAGNGEIWRAWTDTPGGMAIIVTLQSPVALVVHNSSFNDTHLFWTNAGTSDFTGSVMTADAIGGGVKTIASNQSQPRGIAASNSYVYWANMGDGTIMRATYDGSDVKPLVSNLATPSDVAVDANRLYWVEAGSPLDFTDGLVKSSALDGSDVVTIDKAQLDPRRIALDATHVYWMNRGTQGLNACSLHDGSLKRAPKL